MSKCLLQDQGGDGYRPHDLVLEYLKIKMKANVDMAKTTAARQARYLRRPDVVKGYSSRKHGAGGEGLLSLAALWRSAEKLSGDPDLEVDSYRTSLQDFESCEANADVARLYSSIGFLFVLQVRQFSCRCVGVVSLHSFGVRLAA